MKPKDLDTIALLILEAATGSVGTDNVPSSPRRLPNADEEKFVRLRREFDEKYAISTPVELMRF